MGQEFLQRMIRPDLRGLAEYEPIEPYERLSQRWGLPPERIVKLDGNENPYGPSPRALAALANCGRYHIYPDPLAVELREALARFIGLRSEHIIVGSGADEIIDLVMRLCLEPGNKVINCVPTFGMYSFVAAVCGGEAVPVRRGPHYEVDVDAILAALGGRTKIVILASPNNPSGNTVPVGDVRRLLAAGPLVVVDEAYIEFAGPHRSLAPLVSQYDNLVVLRTFSKWAGLAGLRVGYGLGAAPLIRHLEKIKPPYNVNVAGQVAALASLEDLDYLRDKVSAIVGERERLMGELARFGFLRPWPSEANFILCHVLRGDAKALKSALAQRGIFVRYYDTPLLRDAIRMTVGRPEDTDALLSALREVGAEAGLL